MGMPIFTIVFQTLESEAPEPRPAISADKMLRDVEETASQALSNTLCDLYATEVEQRLLQHQSSVEERLRRDLALVFVARNEFWSVFFQSILSRVIATIVFISILVAALFTVFQALDINPTNLIKPSVNAPIVEPDNRTPDEQ